MEQVKRRRLSAKERMQIYKNIMDIVLIVDVR